MLPLRKISPRPAHKVRHRDREKKMSKKKSKKASPRPSSYAGKNLSGQTGKSKSQDSGLYFWMYVIGGILMAIGVFTMYLHHTVPGLVILVIGAVLLFYGNKNKGPDDTGR